MPRSKKAAKKPVGKRAAPPKKSQTITDKIRDDVVAQLKPHIDDMRESTKNELRQIRKDVLAQAAPPTAGPAAAAAAPPDPAAISSLLQSIGIKPDQINQITSALQGLGGTPGAAPAANAPGAPATAPAIPMMDPKWQLLMHILPMIFGQGQGSPLLMELAQRSMLDQMAFATALQRGVISRFAGSISNQVAKEGAGVAVPGMEDYLKASEYYMSPITNPQTPAQPGGGPSPGIQSR